MIRLDLSPHMFIPAAAQGVLAFQVRDRDTIANAAALSLNDTHTSFHSGIERSLLKAFEGGCQVPLGIFVEETPDATIRAWISHADASEDIPYRTTYSIDTDRFQASEVVNAVRRRESSSVFISRPLRHDGYFSKTLNAHGFQVNGEALIGFQGVNFDISTLEFDWIFFSSKNGVKYFFDQCAITNDFPAVAAINQGTAAALRQRGIEPVFIGSGGQLARIAGDFDETNGERVLFPRASNSRRSIQRQLKSKVVSDIVVYENFPIEQIDKREEKILVFTSPMNAENYLSSHEIDDQSIIAIGHSTAEAIKKDGL